MTNKLIPLIDGDVLVYRCGFAVKPDEPTSFAIHNLDVQIDKIRAKFAKAPTFKLYLSGKYNFREQLATIKPYKGNRKDARKPRDYDDMRRWMIEHRDAIVIDGKEADDALGIEQFSDPNRSTVICTIDKDLDTIPGWHYNFVKERLYDISLNEANLNIFYQMLVGDTSDNIPGIDGIGEKRAKALIDKCGGDVVKFREETQQLFRQQYGSNWLEAYHEVGNLIYIQRKDNERCPLL